MSRKKKQAVPEEILAEGSGPVAEAPSPVEELAAAAEHVLPAEPVVDVPNLPPDAPDSPVLAADPDVLEEISDEEAAELGAALPTSAASMDATQLKSLVESLVFASDKPITVQRLRQLTRVGDVRRLEQALADLAEDYKERGIVLQQVSGGFQFRTRTQFSAWVQQLIAGRPVRLSRAQLETLAIIAYRQPITRPEIDEIRGVDSSATLKLLLDRALIRILGKKEEVGRPMLYGTTKDFLDFFSLGDLRELPTLREYSELTDESRQVMSDRLGEEPPDEAVEVAEPVVERPTTLEELVASYTQSIPDDVVATSDVADDVAVDAAADRTASIEAPDESTLGYPRASARATSDAVDAGAADDAGGDGSDDGDGDDEEDRDADSTDAGVFATHDESAETGVFHAQDDTLVPSATASPRIASDDGE